jgi:hypothetical protein
MEQLGSHWTDFHEILYFSIFLNPVDKVKVSLKYNKNNGVLYMKISVRFLNFKNRASYI